MILLDTHVLLWWISEEKSLPKGVLRKIQAHKKKEAIYVSSMSFWEIAFLIKKGRLVLNQDLSSWTEGVLSLPFLNIAVPDPKILIDSVGLPEPFHPDLADRIIVASARHLAATLITKDTKIRGYPHVQTFWEG